MRRDRRDQPMTLSGQPLSGRLPPPKPRRRVGLWVGVALAALVGLPAAGVLGYGYWVMDASRPTLEGTLVLSGLSDTVEVTRDAEGVPTITAHTRLDLARALGFVHGQERFFQMDLLRRAGAGELAALLGPRALPVDRERRVHQFRARMQLALAALPPEARAIGAAYTEGVNAGLKALRHTPWEYALLRQSPAAWREEDSLLGVIAMYFNLQEADPDEQLRRAALREKLGPALAEFLFPAGSGGDAALDGSLLPTPPMPAQRQAALAPSTRPFGERTEIGSNNFAVGGKLTATGAAIVESDMHLGIRVPHIWYRARLRVPGELEVIGVTLPGSAWMVAGSNTHVAWAFTNSYIETGDAVIVEPVPGDPDSYKTPQGSRKFAKSIETICAAGSACETLPVTGTIWGPVMRHDAQGRPIVWRWLAHDVQSVNVAGLAGLETARTVREALDAAHRAGMPNQNIVVGDRDGHIAWTVIGQIPHRVGLNDQLPHSWADGTHGWNGYLEPADIPEVIDPANARLWSANARMLGGDKLAVLGDGGYANPIRARTIRDDLLAADRFSEHDLLNIALDDRAHLLDPWRDALLHHLRGLAEKAPADMRLEVENWGGRPLPGAVGYRLVRAWRQHVLALIYGGLAGDLATAGGKLRPSPFADEPALRLLAERPAGLVPPPFRSWDELVSRAFADLTKEVADASGGTLAAFTWGATNHAGIVHPLAAAVPLLGKLTDAPDDQLEGDTIVPRVAVTAMGASERMVISPGHEEKGIFQMPVGQSDNPLSPYYMAGHKDWVTGNPRPLLPGPERWSLRLLPDARPR